MTEKNCDLVVLGGGGSGLTAAVRAAQVSGKKVIVLEKAHRTGGGMNMASTMRTFRSQWQAERGLPDVTESFLRKAMDATFWRLDVELCRNTILSTGRFFDWFCDLVGGGVGEKFRVGRYVLDDEGGPLGPQMGGPGGITGAGRFFMDHLLEKCGELGVEVLTDTRMRDVEVSNGHITAVLADRPDGQLRVSCRACVLATGSWINKKEVVGELFPQFLQAKKMLRSPHTNPNYTGDGFVVAEKLNAKMDRANYTMRLMGPMTISQKSGTVSGISSSPYTLGVNAAGKRYICEPAEKRFGGFNSGLVLMEQPGGYCYIVFDMNILKASIDRENASPDRLRGPNPFGIFPLPDTFEEAVEDLEAQIAAGSKQVFRGDTLEELIAQLDVDGVEMKKTVDNYNRYCAEGMDWDCFKQKEFLVPCEKGPFYAVLGTLGTDGAFGGINVDPYMQAYRADGSLIEGLYVAGDFASGRFVNLGGVKAQLINDMSWALASGFMAGTNVCRDL